jgi:hypothetical protein
MRDIFPDGLMALDGLEITGNTAATARWLNCDQSSVSRVYRRVSSQLNLGFCKDTQGYGPTNNRELLGCLRQAAQLHRLQQQPPRLQWLNHAGASLDAALPSHCLPVPCRSCQPKRMLELLQQRVIDLLLLSTSTAIAGQPQDLCIRPLQEQEGLSVMVLQEFEHHHALQQLMEHISRSASLRA